MPPQAALDPQQGIYSLDKTLITKDFLDGAGSLSVGITNQTNPIALHKITSNEPLGNTEFIVDKIEATANAGISGVKFLGTTGSVQFAASGDAFAELAVFPDPSSQSFSDALGAVASTKFSLAPDPALTAVMLRWGADASASGSGSIALGAGVGTIDFSAAASGELFFAVIQQADRTTPTDQALADVVQNWKLPVHVRTADDLAPRTHLLSEVGGSLTTSIDATFGHEFNWIRQVTLLGSPALAGDIGLKLQLGLTASFGLTAQGRYAVVVSRETALPVIRVRIYKMRMDDFDFALSASVAATASLPLPANYQDLVKATLGVHALQILTELQDPNAIDNWIKKFGTDYVTELFKKFTGQDLAAALQKVNDLLSRWKNLPASAASLFEKLAEQGVPDFSGIQAAAKIIAQKDTNGLKTFLAQKLSNLQSPFLSTPLGQYLELLAGQGALTLLQNIPDSVSQSAQKVVDFFNGVPIENLLNQIVNEIDSRLGLDAIMQALQGDPSTVLDKLLFDRLTTFLDRRPVLKDIQQLQSAIKALLDKAGALYNKTVQTLTSTYTAQLNATYERTSTDSALIDVSFNFAGDDAQQKGVADALRQLLSGQFDDLLTAPRAGVTLATGTLTHQITRHSHVDLTLPFLKVEGDWVSTATTSFNAIDQNNGRLTMYQLDQVGQAISKNTFTSLWQGRNWRGITVSIAGQLSSLLPQNTGLRIHSDTALDQLRSASGSASIRMEVQNLTLGQLQANIEPFATVFMRQVFSSQGSFHKWTQAGRLLPQPGNTLVSMDVAMPSQAPLAWLKNTAQGKTDPVYQRLSLQLQFLLRAYLPRYYFQDINQYKTPSTAYLVLLYAALPPSNSMAPPTDIYWDTQDKNQVMIIANKALNNGSFSKQLAQAQSRLQNAGLNSLAAQYDPQMAGNFFNVATDDNNFRLLQDSLLLVESSTILDARDAGLSAAQFNQLRAANKPVEALNALADFGNKIVSAFNKDLSSVFVQSNDALQRLSPLLFAQAASVFDQSLPVGNFDSTLNVTVLKPGVAMPSDFPDFIAAQKDILVSLNSASFAA